MPLSYSDIQSMLASQPDLLTHVSTAVPKERLHLPGPGAAAALFAQSDRSAAVQANLKALYDHGRLGKTGYLSILPVDQGIEHSAAASFTANPDYFDPEAIVKLAIDGGCNAVASTLGVLGMTAGKYASKIPFIVKLNHNELLTYPNKFDQVMFATAQQAKDMGAAGVGATVYFGAPESTRQLIEVSRAFAEAHRLGMFTVLWCYLRNPSFKVGGVDYHASADLTGQANHLGVTIEADIIKQKLPVNTGGMKALNGAEGSYGKIDPKSEEKLLSPHVIDLARYQVLHCYAGRVGLISSGGPSGSDDLREAVSAAVINKRAGGTGLIAGRKAFQKSHDDGVALLHAIQDVYLCPEVTVA